MAATTADTAERGRVRDARSARQRRRARTGARRLLGLAAWAIGLIFVAPVAWMVLTSLHSEGDAATNPPSLGAELTLTGYEEFFSSNPWPALINSTSAAVVSTLLVLALAIPAAYALSIKPVEKWTDVMFFFLSTKMLPAVAALLPVYLIAKNLSLLDNIVTLIVLYASMNLPIAVWMMRSFLAKLCAAAMVVSLPVLAAGFATQDKLVQGLSLGAVK